VGAPTRRAVAGRIKTNIALNSIKFNATAAAAAKRVVTTRVAKFSMAIMVTSRSCNVLQQWEWHAERHARCIENKGLIRSA
jgi:hypothetical protein